MDSAWQIIAIILDRFCHDGIDRFFLIFHGVWVSDFDGNFLQDFYSYLKKNLLNLLLPGTVYPEAYAPSSQIFGSVLFGRCAADRHVKRSAACQSEHAAIYLVRHCFHVWQCSGASHYVSFWFSACFALSLGSKFDIKATLLGYSGSTLSSFGPETNIANATQLFISMMFMAGVMLLLSHLNMRRQ